MPHLAWAVHEGDGVYRYGGRTEEALGRLRLVDEWTRPLEPDGGPASDVYFTIALAIRKAWREGDGRYPERVEVEELRYHLVPPPPPRPRPEVVRSGRLRRPDTRPMTLRELAEREAPGWKPSKE
jgi:hypothetical protein